MKKLLIIFACGLLFTNCKRNHYYCKCYDSQGPVFIKDYGTNFPTKELTLKKDCDSRKVTNTTCDLIAE